MKPAAVLNSQENICASKKDDIVTMLAYTKRHDIMLCPDCKKLLGFCASDNAMEAITYTISVNFLCWQIGGCLLSPALI